MKDLKSALLFLLVSTMLLGGVYPLLTTGLATLIFPGQAGGSLVSAPDGHPIGSALLGQPFAGPGYFHSRPSATGDHPYNPAASGGSNYGPTNPEFLGLVQARVADFQAAHPGSVIPGDLVLASASGLDPHLTPVGALAQAAGVAQARGMAVDEVRQLVEARIEDRQWGILGEPRVNVLLLNLDLDRRRP